MNIATICNCAAWCGCCVIGALLLADFIRTERQIAKDNKEEMNCDE